jgi:ribosomal protein S18 acetylase RimI-like enzyme
LLVRTTPENMEAFMEIRKIHPEEINEVVRMWKEFVDNQYQYDDFFVRSPEGMIHLKNKLHEYQKDDHYLLIGAFNGSEVAGYILAQVSEHPPFFNNKRFCNVRHVFVKEKYRNQKYGENMMLYTKNWALSKGIKRLELLVAANNDRAIRFYHNMGFKDFCKVLSLEI